LGSWEQNGDRDLERRLGAAYRPLGRALVALLEAESGRPHPALASLAMLGAEARPGRIAQPLAILAPTLVHMHLNRLLRSEQRAQEGTLLAHLTRAYGALRATSRRPSPSVR